MSFEGKRKSPTATMGDLLFLAYARERIAKFIGWAARVKRKETLPYLTPGRQ
jgi:hypothetical protein